MIILGMEVKFRTYLMDWSVALIISGILILFLGKKLIKNINSSILKKFLTQSFGIILLLTGVDYFLETYMTTYWLFYIIAGVIIFQYKDLIVNQL